MYSPIINKLGLSKLQAELLNYLLSEGANKASAIAKKINRPRGVAYKGLDELIELKLAHKSENKKGLTIYQAEHPANLELLFEQKEKELARIKQEFNTNLPELISAYNSVSDKPGIKIYEGGPGIQKALEDTLKSQETIYTFADIEAVEKNLKTINDEYLNKRQKNLIKKKVIVADTSFNRKFLAGLVSDTTEYRLLDPKFYDFNSGMQIYDNKISYQVISPNKKMAIIIDDANIYRLNRLIFEYIWESLKEVTIKTNKKRLVT